MPRAHGGSMEDGGVLVPRSFDGEIEDREVDSMEPWLGFLMRQHPTHIGLDMALQYACSS